jgi:electron transport complex protein RnfG
MSVMKQMITVMLVIGVFSSLLLAASDQLTRPLIEKHKLEALQNSIFQVLAGTKEYEEISTETFKVYKGFTEQKELVGYAFIAEGSGFQGNIRMIVGINPGLDTLLGLNVLEQSETPGLGGNIVRESFQNQFSGLKLAASENFVSYVKNVTPQNPGEIQAITGATISSKAVVNILNNSIAELRKIVK